MVVGVWRDAERVVGSCVIDIERVGVVCGKDDDSELMELVACF